MKKIKTHPTKSTTSVKITKPRSRVQLIGGLMIVLIIASVGLATLRFSLAATANIDIIVNDSQIDHRIADITVTVKPTNSSTPNCASGTKANTNSIGVATFVSCQTPVGPDTGYYYIDAADLAFRGYQLAANSPKQIGFGVNSVVIAGSTGYIYAVPIDTDGDGLPDRTGGYINDQCPNAAGPGSNNGCPIAPTPAAPAPSSPAPTTTTTTPATPTTPNSTIKKSASTITSKPSTATPTPAVVVATSGDTTPPSPPDDFTIDLNSTTNFLSWVDSSDNVGVIGYNIDRSTDQKQWDPLVQKVSDTFYTDQNLTAGKHYYYRVRALDAAGNMSEGAMADIAIPKSNAKKTNVPAVKKASSTNAIPLLAGILLLLVALFAAFWLFRRHSQNANDEYSYDVALPPPTNNATVYTPDQPAEHTSISLADMVAEDMKHHQNPPEPPQPPVPPTTPPAPPQA